MFIIIVHQEMWNKIKGKDMNNERYLAFNGENWEEILEFIEGGDEATIVTEYFIEDEKLKSIEYITTSVGINIVKGDYAVWLSENHLEIFTEEEWRDYTLPFEVLEYERLYNILNKYIEPGVAISALIQEVTEDEIVLDMVDDGEFAVRYSINETPIQFKKTGKNIKISLDERF